MTTAANYRSIFTNNNVDDSKGLYEPTKLIATNGGSGTNLPVIFVNLVGDDSPTAPTATIIQEAPSIDQIDASNDRTEKNCSLNPSSSISNQVKPGPGPGIALNTKIITAVPTIVNRNSSGSSLISLNIKNKIIITEPTNTIS